MIARASKRRTTGIESIKRMANGGNGKAARSRIVRFGDSEVVTEGRYLSFWADISHRCMTASWPSFIGGAAIVFTVFNALFALLYWIGDQPIANVPGGAYVDYLYFSIEKLSTAGYGDMHPQTHFGHFIATVELFTGIFSMSLMTGLIFARFSRPKARLLFADHPVIANHEGKPTLMVRLANERDNVISEASARLWMYKNERTKEGHPFRRFSELPLIRGESPALALSWTLFHAIDQDSPLYGLSAEDLAESHVSFILLISGYDEVAGQDIRARTSYGYQDIRHGHRYVDIVGKADDGRIKINYGHFHDTFRE